MENDVEANYENEDGRANPLARCKAKMEEDH